MAPTSRTTTATKQSTPEGPKPTKGPTANKAIQSGRPRSQGRPDSRAALVVGMPLPPPTPPPDTSNTRQPPYPYRRSRESGNPGPGRGAGRLRPPSHPLLLTARALPESVRPEPIEGPPATSSARRPRTPPPSYRRKPVSRGAPGGAPPLPTPVASPTLPTPPHARFPNSFALSLSKGASPARRSRAGRNPAFVRSHTPS